MKFSSIIVIFLFCSIMISGCVSTVPDENFLSGSNTKTTVRELAHPISDVASFNTIVTSFISGNPLGCTPYTTDGQSHAPVEKVLETYSARLEFEDANASVVNTIGYESSNVNGFNTGIAVLMASVPLAKAQGGICIHDPDEDSYYVMLRCHDPNGEIYYVTFMRDSVVLSQYSDDAIRTRFEDWANGLQGLAPVKERGRENVWWEQEIDINSLSV